MGDFFRTDSLSVGYRRTVLIQGIRISLKKGMILTLIGPNGAGKSTVLKTLIRQLVPISGDIRLDDRSILSLPGKSLAKKMAVVLTERVRPGLMTCADIVAMGRYPYTDMFGKLTEKDKAAVAEALEKVHAADLADQEFSTLSDGQQQRILLARAICQEPEVLILDEPTAYLDIRFKIDLLGILQDMVRTKGTVIIMSLHEIDLAMKISDELLCLDGEKVLAYGSPETVISDQTVGSLYQLQEGSYNLLFGSVELRKAEGEPRIFVISGNGHGTPVYRALQKRGIPFAAGILFGNDADSQTAEALSSYVIKTPAFEPPDEETFSRAAALLTKCEYVWDSGVEIGTLNCFNAELLKVAGSHNIPIIHSIREIQSI